MTLGEEIIAWIETTCRVPEGALVGQPLVLMEWQRDAIRKTHDNPHGSSCAKVKQSTQGRPSVSRSGGTWYESP